VNPRDRQWRFHERSNGNRRRFIRAGDGNGVRRRSLSPGADAPKTAQTAGLQAYLKHTYEDIVHLLHNKCTMRICKGIYVEDEAYLIDKGDV
jgi:hypothetical protein